MADTNTVHVGMPGTPPLAASYDARLVRVETAVSGMQGDIAELNTTVKVGLKEIGNQVSAKSQLNWPALALLAAILTPALGWGWGQLGAMQTRMDSSSAKLETALSAAVAEQKAALAAATAEEKARSSQFESRAEITTTNAFVGQISDLKAQLAAKDAAVNSAKVDRLAADILDLQGKIVPLSTHQELWAAQHEANKALAAQIDENRRSLADITAPRDTISRIFKRLDDVESIMRKAGGRGGE